jgi:hypothetical protein
MCSEKRMRSSAPSSSAAQPLLAGELGEPGGILAIGEQIESEEGQPLAARGDGFLQRREIRLAVLVGDDLAVDQRGGRQARRGFGDARKFVGPVETRARVDFRAFGAGVAISAR